VQRPAGRTTSCDEASQRQDDNRGPWRLPDWELVMEHYDGVHVTVGGFLASRRLALPVGDGYTMLAGWIPGATLWLRDLAAVSRPLGRWHGHPQCLDWDEVREHWAPCAEPPHPAPPSS